MKVAVKKKLEAVLSKLPDSKLLLCFTVTILLGVLLYVIILFF